MKATSNYFPLYRKRRKVLCGVFLLFSLLYAGNNSREAHNYVTTLASKVKELFPDTEVYTFFTPPRWICQAGDFSTIEEAEAMLHQLKSFLLLK
ncbi:hypothetical protein EZS27_040513, partial [termite gut metagenome]